MTDTKDYKVISVVDNDTDKDLFIHTADIHLAPRVANITKRDGITGRLQRDLDMDIALSNAVDDVLAADPKPCAFVVAGDIFDTWKGSPDAFITAVSQFRRLTDAGIAIVGIAGNHDTPPNIVKTSMFQMLEGVCENNPFIELAYDEIKHVKVGDIEFVLLPHAVCLRGGFTEEDLSARSDAKYKVLVVHGVAAGDPSLKQMDEAKEIPISRWILDMDWDYIAFGHYHKPGWIPGYKTKAAYSGSLENTVISGPDVCSKRGPLYVDLSKAHTKDVIKMHPQPIRRIMTISDIDITGKDITAVQLDDIITKAIEKADTKDAIVIHKVKGISKSLFKTIPHRNFSHVAEDALYIRTDFELAKDAFLVSEVLSVNEDTNVEGSEEATTGTGIEIDASKTFLPLEKEIELAVHQLVSAGNISENKEEDVTEILLGFLTQ